MTNVKFDKAMDKIMRLGTVSVKITEDELEYDITEKLVEMKVQYTKSVTMDALRRHKYIQISIVN